MSTQKQIEANRLNAQLSTGSRSAEGKRSSSQNALKSGLDAASQFVLGESPEEFAQLQAEYFGHFAPTTPEERFQVDNLIRNEWTVRRLHRVESQLWEYYAMQADRSSGVSLGEAFAKTSTVFNRLHRRITAVERAYKEAKTELARLRQVAQPEETKEETEELGSFLTPSMRPAAADLAVARLDLFLQKKLAKSQAQDHVPPKL